MLKRLLIALFCFPLLVSFTLSDQIQKGKVGSFIVTQQNKTCCLLHLHSFHQNSVILEEICIPIDQLSRKKMDWKQWVRDKAPGHTSWTMFEIDLTNGQTLESFSFSRNAWVHSDDFLSKLFQIPLKKVPEQDRKKIGPSPAGSRMDTRKNWNPPLVRDGKKISGAPFDVYQCRWPKDETELSQKKIQIYFDGKDSSFPFPFWMQISDGSHTFKIRPVDSGFELQSPYSTIPRRAPEFIGTLKQEEGSFRLMFKTPPYFKEFELYALDLNNFGNAISLSFSLQPAQEKNIFYLDIEKEVINNTFQKMHHYRFLLVPKDAGNIFTETKEVWRY